MPTDYIPSEDGAALVWMQNFRDNINSDPPRFGLTPSDAAAITVVVDDYETKRALAVNEQTRTKLTIADKVDARAVAEQLCRQYAIQIKNAAGVTDGDKLIVGVRPINTNRENIEPPTTFPLLSILGNTPGCQTMRYSDSDTPDSAAKPFGATGMQLYLAVGETESAPLADAAFHGMYTRNPIAVEFSEPDDGKIATYYARWMSAKGETGPWSLPISMRIAA